jgi:hypothetical protein
MFVEVSVPCLIILLSHLTVKKTCWLVAGFVWGTIRLFGVLDIIQLDVHEGDGLSRFAMLQDSDEREAGWGFGQVVAVVLLLAPLITMVKYFTYGTPCTFNAPNI